MLNAPARAKALLLLAAFVVFVASARVVTATIIVDGATRTSPWGAAGNTKHYDFENGDKIDGASDVIQGKKVFPGTTAASSSPITFDISAGTLNLSQAFGVGGAASATATMTGGEINIADDNYADTGFIVRSNGTFNFGGGVVNLAEQQEADFLIETGGVFNWTTGSTGVFNWTGGDRTSRLTTLASSMTIAGSAATAADFNIAYDSGVTTMTLPEPATMSLLALGGLAMLRRRRS